MCECLEDAHVCAACGSLVEMQLFEDEPKLMHFVGHEGPDDDGVVDSVWQVHDRETCLQTRQEQWELLVKGGIAEELV